MNARPHTLDQLHALISRDPEGAPGLSHLARLAALSPSRLTRAFRERFGLTPTELTRSLRRDRLKQALRSGDDVTGAIYTAGFGSPSRVYEEGSHLIGMTPGSYRRGAEGVAIRYTIVRSPVGPLLVAATERGVCAVTLGDDDATLEAGLAKEFPAATRTRVDEGADEWLAAVVRRVAEQLGLAEPHSPRTIPADLRATAFQWRVWHALTRIPGGETRSYADIAREIGSPRSVRAVARACASNRLAIVVPCHRVIREDGSAGGYRWGLPRKQALLALEKSNRVDTGAARKSA